MELITVVTFFLLTKLFLELIWNFACNHFVRDGIQVLEISDGRCCQREPGGEHLDWAEHQDRIRLLSPALEEKKRHVGRTGDARHSGQN